MSEERQKLEAAIAALEAQRAFLGDAVVDASVAALRSKLSEPVASSAEAPQALRQVTILFLDVVGSTTLSQRLDPEEIQAVMDGALARYTAIVKSHHGRVLKYAGDSVLAVFGADEAREDDPERAVHAGLALLQEGRRQGELITLQKGHEGFNIRVGIHTGDVLLGGGVDAEASIRGIAVNIAARMEQSALPGTLRISHDTFRHVRGLFEFEAQPAIALKGLDKPFNTYRVISAKPRPFQSTARGIEGVETRMIGRDAELDALCERFERTFVERQMTTVVVAAEAGFGKSRLLHEFRRWVEPKSTQFHLLQGRASPQTPMQAYGLLRDLFARWLQIADDDTLQVARKKMEHGIIPLFVNDDGKDLAEGHAHLLGHLLGLDFSTSRHISGIRHDPQQIRNRAFHAAAQTFRRLIVQDGNPVVLQLEDLHWADDPTLDFLDYLARTAADVPLLILAFARPILFERRADWPGGRGRNFRIDLQPLDEKQSRLLAIELLRKLPAVPDSVSELIIDRAEGNPFYMEELIQMLVDQGAIETGSTAWSVHPERLGATHIPSTLTGILQARLDGLPPAQKQVLQEASVIGHVFWDQPLALLDARAPDLLPDLERRDLALPHAEASLDGLREYAFRHHILHQVTYGTVLKHVRRELHGKVARWFSRLTGARANDFLGITAVHFEEAGDALNAAEFHARAAEHMKDRFSHEGVLDHVRHGLALLDKIPEKETAALRWRLLEAREQTYDLLGMRGEQDADIDTLGKLSESMDDDRRRAYTSFRRSYLAYRTGDPPASEQAARRAIALAAKTDDDGVRLRAQRLLAFARRDSGDFGAAREVASQGLTTARGLGMKEAESGFLDTLAGIAGWQEDLLGTVELSRESLAIERETRDRRGEVLTLGNLGAAWLGLGDFEQATRMLEESLRLAQAIGDRTNEGVCLGNLAQVAQWQGDGERALALSRAAHDLAVATKGLGDEVFALLVRGDAELLLGHPDEAFGTYEQAQTLAVQIDSPFRHNATAGLIRVALSKGDTPAALQLVDLLLPHLGTGGALDGADCPRLIELTCYQALTRAGDERAAAVLETAYESLQARVDRLSDATLRYQFLTNIPHHREIVAAWRMVSHGGTPPNEGG